MFKSCFAFEIWSLEHGCTAKFALFWPLFACLASVSARTCFVMLHKFAKCMSKVWSPHGLVTAALPSPLSVGLPLLRQELKGSRDAVSLVTSWFDSAKSSTKGFATAVFGH